MNNLATKDFSDPLIKEYQPTLWSDIYLRKVSVVPEDLREFAATKGRRYLENGFGYVGKDYSDLQKSIQIDANAVSDEATVLYLINNDQDFINRVNKRITDLANEGQIYVSPKTGKPFIISGKYMFNANHGMTDHDLPQQMTYEKGKTYADLLSTGYREAQTAWRVEVKTDINQKKPSGMHKAEIVFLHILGTNEVEMYLPTAENSTRTDDTYICAGHTSTNIEWHNIRIDKDWTIKPW
jgi:hypothetical protein